MLEMSFSSISGRTKQFDLTRWLTELTVKSSVTPLGQRVAEFQNVLLPVLGPGRFLAGHEGGKGNTMNWIVKKRKEKKRTDLERLADLIETEYQVAQMEADILERQLDPDAPLVQQALRLRNAFNDWYEKYRDVLAAYDEFEAEKARHKSGRRLAVLSTYT